MVRDTSETGSTLVTC